MLLTHGVRNPFRSLTYYFQSPDDGKYRFLVPLGRYFIKALDEYFYFLHHSNNIYKIPCVWTWIGHTYFLST